MTPSHLFFFFFCRVRKGVDSCPLPVHYIVQCFSNTVFPSGFSSWRVMKWILVVTFMGFRITLETNLSLSVRCWLDELRWEDLPEMWLAPLYRLGSRNELEGERELKTGSDSSPLVNRCTVANCFQLLPHDSHAMLDCSHDQGETVNFSLLKVCFFVTTATNITNIMFYYCKSDKTVCKKSKNFSLCKLSMLFN